MPVDEYDQAREWDPPRGDRATYNRLARMESDIRSIRQTLREQVVPKLSEHEVELSKLRNRFVYALATIGTLVGAYVALVQSGTVPAP